jgi:hypothetical protein
MSTPLDLSPGDIVRARPPRERTRLARVLAVSPEGVTVANLLRLGGALHPQVFATRVLHHDAIEPATRAQKALVEKWEAGPGKDLRASCRSPKRPRGRR